MAKVRDPDGIAELRAARMTNTVGDSTMLPAIEKAALIMAAKGGMMRDITVGDCLESMRISREVFAGPTRSSRHSPVFYQLLHSIGTFPADAPPTVRMFSPLFAGRLPVEQLVDRYQLASRPIRDSLVDYLRVTATGDRLQHADRAGHGPGSVVLEGPGAAPSGHRLAAADSRDRRRLEAAGPNASCPVAQRLR
jgi:hypothetical protein